VTADTLNARKVYRFARFLINGYEVY